MTDTRRVITAFQRSATNRDQLSAQVPRPQKVSKPLGLVKANPNSGSVVLVDSPNATKTVDSAFGSNARPDWQAILRIGSSLGSSVRAIMAVNDGLPEHVIKNFRGIGYAVQLSHARDVDDRLVSQAIRMIDRAQVFVIVSGDGGYCSLVTTLRRLGKRVIVVAVEKRCHPDLRAKANEFCALPILMKTAGSRSERNNARVRAETADPDARWSPTGASAAGPV